MKELNDIDLKSLIEQETGEKFNRDGYIKCPFHNEKTPSMSVKFFPNANKQRYKCWGCECQGDAIDFIVNYKNMNYNEARKHLDLEVENNPTEDFEETIRQFVRNQVAKGNKQGYKPLGIFTFVDENNKPIYSKVKFLKHDGKKETPYYHIEEGQVIRNRSHEEVPYNYYNLLQGIANNKIVVIVEGEKDVNTLRHMLAKNQYVVTSLKDFKDYDKIKSEFMKVYVIGDTGKAGLKYVDNIKYNFLNTCKSFKIINLKGIQALGDNKDVTDWLEAGYTKEDLLNCFDRSLDLKDKNQLQQDKNGIYYLKYIKSKEDYDREYLTNFNVLEASKVNKIDAEVQGIRIKLQSCIDGKIVEKIGGSKIFDDIRAFRNFLDMDFSFTGKNTNEVVRLKDWINKYYALDNKEIYQGAKFIPIEGNKVELITSNGTLSYKGCDYSKIAEETDINLTDIEEITALELNEVMRHLFNLFDYEKSLNIIGSAISTLEVGQAISLNVKMHHLFIIGESGSGKSTILENVVAPLLNYPITEKEGINTSRFSLEKLLSIGNYPILFDEFKPSLMDDRKKSNLKDIFHKSYDRMPISKGNKNFEIKKFYLNRPMIIAGEEGIMDNEKASVTRSCIVYLSKKDRAENSTKTKDWIIDNENLLKKLGKSLVLESLNLSIEEYKELRILLRDKFKDLSDRPQNTAISIACGIELLNKVLIKNCINPITNYTECIKNNIHEEILENGEDAYSIVEQMLIMYNNMIQNNNHFVDDDAVQFAKDGKDFGKLFIRTQLMIDAIFKYCNEVKEIDTKTLLTSRDFKKQAKKAGYIKGVNTKQLRIGAYQTYSGKNAWFDEYDKDLLKKLRIDSIVDCDGWEDAVSFAEGQF